MAKKKHERCSCEESLELRKRLKAVRSSLRNVCDWSKETGQCVVCDLPVMDCDEAPCIGGDLRELARRERIECAKGER